MSRILFLNDDPLIRSNLIETYQHIERIEKGTNPNIDTNFYYRMLLWIENLPGVLYVFWFDDKIIFRNNDDLIKFKLEWSQ